MTPHSVPAPGGNSPVIRLDGVTKTYQPGAPAAVAFGATAVIFAFGLSSSLHRAAQSQSLSATVPVQVQPFGPGSGPGQAPTAAQDAAVTAALRAQPGTGHDVAVYTAQVKVPGVAQNVLAWAFGGDSSWTGYGLVAAGRVMRGGVAWSP